MLEYLEFIKKAYLKVKSIVYSAYKRKYIRVLPIVCSVVIAALIIGSSGGVTKFFIDQSSIDHEIKQYENEIIYITDAINWFSTCAKQNDSNKSLAEIKCDSIVKYNWFRDFTYKYKNELGDDFFKYLDNKYYQGLVNELKLSRMKISQKINVENKNIIINIEMYRDYLSFIFVSICMLSLIPLFLTFFWYYQYMKKSHK